MQAHKVICRLKNGKIKKYEVDGVETAVDARKFVISQVKDARTVLALVNTPLTNATLIPFEHDDGDLPPKQYA